jgi:nucleoid DNA-binding protein
VAEIVDAFIDETSDAVIAGDRVTVRARDLPAFRPGKPFRDEVGRRRRKPAAKSKAKAKR